MFTPKSLSKVLVNSPPGGTLLRVWSPPLGRPRVDPHPRLDPVSEDASGNVLLLDGVWPGTSLPPDSSSPLIGLAMDWPDSASTNVFQQFAFGSWSVSGDAGGRCCPGDTPGAGVLSSPCVLCESPEVPLTHFAASGHIGEPPALLDRIVPGTERLVASRTPPATPGGVGVWGVLRPPWGDGLDRLLWGLVMWLPPLDTIEVPDWVFVILGLRMPPPGMGAEEIACRLGWTSGVVNEFWLPGSAGSPPGTCEEMNCSIFDSSTFFTPLGPFQFATMTPSLSTSTLCGMLVNSNAFGGVPRKWSKCSRLLFLPNS